MLFYESSHLIYQMFSVNCVKQFNNGSARLYKLSLPKSNELIVAHVFMTSEHIRSKSDTNVTCMYCAVNRNHF